MSEDPKQRINRIREKINELSKINPNTYLSDRQLDKINQKLQEKRKGIITFTQSDHHKSIFERNALKHTIPLIKKVQDTETIVGNYFKKIELKKQQSANNQSLKIQKQNQIFGVKSNAGKESDGNNAQRNNLPLVRDHQLKQTQTTPDQITKLNNKQGSLLQDNSTSSAPQIDNSPDIFQVKEKRIEPIVVVDSPRKEKPVVQKVNPFLPKKQQQIKSYKKQEQFIDIDKQISKKKTNIFTQDFSKHPPKNPFPTNQQKKIENIFQKPKIRQNQQSMFLQQNPSKIRRIDPIQVLFQPVKRMNSQPAPSSNMPINKNNTDSIFARSVISLNLDPVTKSSTSQNNKKVNQVKYNSSSRQQNNMFNNKDMIIKNIGIPKPLSSISESISEQHSALDQSALKVPKQRKIPLFQDRSSKKHQKQIQKNNNNHQVQFQSFGPTKSNQMKPIEQKQDNVKQIPKLQYKQPQKVNIFTSNIGKNNDQSGTTNPFNIITKHKPEQKTDTNNTSSTAPTSNIFEALLNKSKNIFSQPNPETKTQNIFTKMTASNNIFGKPNFQKNEEQNDQIEDNDSENSNELIEDEDNADPNLSTVKYDYEKPDLIFKEPANKFRCGNEQNSLLENMMISLQKMINSEDVLLIARMPNKLVSFTGKLIKNITKIRILNNSSKNVEITKILSISPNKPNELAIVRIQFKDIEAGSRFISQVQKIIN